MIKRPYAIALIVAVVFLSYANSLFNPFMWDDKWLIPDNPAIKEGWKSILTAFSPEMWGGRADNEAFQRYYRPIHTLVSVIDYQIWGLNPFGYHLTNTLIHLVNSVLIFFLAVRLTKNDIASIIAAMIFAAHPIHTEAVTFISARVDLLASLFLFVSFLLYIKSREEKGGGVLFYALSLFAFLLALLSKEMALTLPLLIAVYAFVFEEKGKRVLRAAPFFGVLLAYVLFRVFALSSFVASHKTMASPATLLLTASVAVFDYVRLMFIPYPLKAYHSIVWQAGVSLKMLASVVLLAVSGIAVVVLYLKDKKAEAYAIFWTFLTIAPVLNIGALGEFSIAERYAYIPTIGFSIFAGLMLYRLGKSGAYKYAAAAVVVVFMVLTFQRNRVWADELVFYKAMAEGAQDSALPRANLASVYMKKGDIDKALIELEAAARLAQNNALIRYELGMLYGQKGRFSDAVAEFQAAIDLKPDYIEAMNASGMAWAELGRLDYSEGFFLKALEIDPAFTPARSNLEKIRNLKAGRKG